MNEQFEMEMEPLVELFLETLENGTCQRPTVDHLSQSDQKVAHQIFDMLEATWGSSHIASSASDIEKRAGVVDESDTSILLDGKAIKKARAALGLKPSDVGRALETSQARLTTQELVKLELQQAKSIPLDQARALASALKTPLSNLVHSGKGGLVEYVFGPRFEQQVTAWANDNGIDVSASRKTAQTKMLAAKLRSSGAATEADLDRMLCAVLESMS
jgi:DNA-binding transcriptional regulator YiaG